MTTTVHVDREGPVTIVAIDRPERRNAVDPATATALLEAFTGFDADPSSSGAVLAGDGGTFCAGADLKALAAGDRHRVAEDGPGPMGPTRLQMSKPVVAAVEGYAVAGGLELAVWCDLRVASADATFGVFCRRFGVPLIDGGTVRLPRLIGHGRAPDLILTGREVGADEALAIGLVNRVVPPGTARETAVAWGRELAALPQTCMRNDRLSVVAQWGLSTAEAMLAETRLGLDSLASSEAASGAREFPFGAVRLPGPFPPPDPRRPGRRQRGRHHQGAPLRTGPGRHRRRAPPAGGNRLRRGAPGRPSPRRCARPTGVAPRARGQGGHRLGVPRGLRQGDR